MVQLTEDLYERAEEILSEEKRSGFARTFTATGEWQREKMRWTPLPLDDAHSDRYVSEN